MFSEKVSGVASLRELVASVAGPRQWSDTRESWLARAARRAGISFRQAKALFYGEIRDPNHKSARLMRDAAAAQFESLSDVLEQIDADFHRAQIDAHRNLARTLRGASHPRRDQAGPGNDPTAGGLT